MVLGVSLVTWELRAGHPFFDVRLLARNLALTRTYLRWAIGGLCVYTVLYGVTQWLEAGRGTSSREAGLLLLPMSVMSALVVRQVSKRNLVRVPLIVSAVSCLAASAGVLLLTTSSPVIWIIVITLVFGIALGTSASGNQITLYSQVPPAQIGTAAGLFRTWGYIGSIASSAIISMVFRTSVTDHGLHVIALVMIAVSAVALLITVADKQLMSVSRIRRAGSECSEEQQEQQEQHSEAQTSSHTRYHDHDENEPEKSALPSPKSSSPLLGLLLCGKRVGILTGRGRRAWRPGLARGCWPGEERARGRPR
jgi:MFS family permease